MTTTIDMTPDNDGYAAIGATFVASVLGDVRNARKNDAQFLLTAAIDLAFSFGLAAGQGNDVAEGERLRDALFQRVGGPRR